MPPHRNSIREACRHLSRDGASRMHPRLACLTVEMISAAELPADPPSFAEHHWHGHLRSRKARGLSGAVEYAMQPTPSRLSSNAAMRISAISCDERRTRSSTTLLKVPVNSTLLRKRASIASRCARAPRARLRSIHARGGSSVTSRHWNMPESSSSAWSRCSLDSSTLTRSATPEIGTGTGTRTGTGF